MEQVSCELVPEPTHPTPDPTNHIYKLVNTEHGGSKTRTALTLKNNTGSEGPVDLMQLGSSLLLLLGDVCTPT